MTLKELWESRGLNPTQLAARAGISTPTLYKMNKKETVAARTVVSLCNALHISREEYERLEPDRSSQ